VPKDYYQILGVSRDAPSDEIKKAFRRLARETQPDANPGDSAAEARFRDVAEAYEVLSDAERRRVYDRGGQVDLGDLLSGFGSFDDLLRSVFGDGGLFGTGARSGPVRGRDVLARVTVDLHDAAFGADTEVSFRAGTTCSECHGSGARPGSERFTCPSCNGAGAVRMARRGLLGTVMSVATCETCAGAGEVIAEPCERCVGTGVHTTTRSMRVEVPAGVATGTRLKYSREGEAAPHGGPSGDLYIEITVAGDERFERAGDQLVHRASVGIAEAALGTTIEIPLIDGGTERLTVPPGTQHGWQARMPGRGMSRLGRRGRGDLVVEVGVRVPTEMTPEQAELIRAFAELDGQHPDPPPGQRRRRGR